MVKAKASKKRASKSVKAGLIKTWLKKHRVITLLLVIVLLFGLYYCVRASYEWAQFKLAERKVDSLYALTLKELGEPEYKSLEGSCGHASAKYSKGDLSCYYGFVLVYKPANQEEINNMHEKFAIMAKSSGEKKEQNNDAANKLYKNNEQYYEIKNRLGLTCVSDILNTNQSVMTRHGDIHSRKDFGQVTVVSGICYKGPLIRAIYQEVS